MDEPKGCPCCSAKGADMLQTNASNIWQTMAKEVRDVDEQKVDNTKEDIDTLLVFAGLFSAVVTTFVVDSYASLQPDNTDEIVFLMRQSLVQNYTFADGVLRPVAPFPQDQPFEVPLWALRVNGLWFASLIVSLSTASFGMLVKQWLIEYLVAERHYISPQDKLRARQYRHPGLKDWKVFEIAALLPLLLHVSLGLFFLGLCFYTAAANEIVGRSTFPLVAGWAFCAMLTVVAPLASPRCPYKITLLKSGLRIGRRYISSRFWGPTRAAGRGAVVATKWTWRYIICLPYRLWRAFIEGFATLLEASTDVTPLLGILVAIFFAPFLLFQFILVYLTRFALFLISDPGTDTDEEDDIMERPYKPHELLLSVDEVITSDGPILETMVEVLRQIHTSPPYITIFVLGCIQHRITSAERDLLIPDVNEHIRGLLRPHTLSEHAWDLLAELAGEALKTLPTNAKPISVQKRSQFIWQVNAVAVILSDSRRPLPDNVRGMLTDPATLANMLQSARSLFQQWPRRDVCSVIWVALSAPSRTHGVMAMKLTKNWSRLGSLYNSSEFVDELPTTLVQILLENAWREDDYEDAEDADEAVLMLHYLLGSAQPLPVDDDLEVLLASDSSDNTSQSAEYMTKEIGSPRIRQSRTLAARLGKAVGQTQKLVLNALNFYRSFILEQPQTRTSSRLPLWRALRDKDPSELTSEDLRPVMLDLWDFLCICVGSDANAAKDHLQTPDFIKLCLVLARPGVPSIFGRDDATGRSDWDRLVPVLEATIETGDLIENLTFSTAVMREDAIPTLAHRALQALENPPPGYPDCIPGQLLRVLHRLAGKGPRPPPKQDVSERREQGEGILGTGLRVPQFPRRESRKGEESASSAARRASVILEDGPMETEPPNSAARHWDKVRQHVRRPKPRYAWPMPTAKGTRLEAQPPQPTSPPAARPSASVASMGRTSVFHPESASRHSAETYAPRSAPMPPSVRPPSRQSMETYIPRGAPVPPSLRPPSRQSAETYVPLGVPVPPSPRLPSRRSVETYGPSHSFAPSNIKILSPRSLHSPDPSVPNPRPSSRSSARTPHPVSPEAVQPPYHFPFSQGRGDRSAPPQSFPTHHVTGSGPSDPLGLTSHYVSTAPPSRGVSRSSSIDSGRPVGAELGHTPSSRHRPPILAHESGDFPDREQPSGGAPAPPSVYAGGAATAAAAAGIHSRSTRRSNPESRRMNRDVAEGDMGSSLHVSPHWSRNVSKPPTPSRPDSER